LAHRRQNSIRSFEEAKKYFSGQVMVDLFMGDLLAVDFQNTEPAWVRQRELPAGDQAPCLLLRSARGPRHAGARSAAVSVPRDGLAAGERVAAMAGIERVWLGGARKKPCNILSPACPQAAITPGAAAPGFEPPLGNHARTTASQKTIRTRKNMALPSHIDRFRSSPRRAVYRINAVPPIGREFERSSRRGPLRRRRDLDEDVPLGGA
jgi:hypothetical protein